MFVRGQEGLVLFDKFESVEQFCHQIRADLHNDLFHEFLIPDVKLAGVIQVEFEFVDSARLQVVEPSKLDESSLDNIFDSGNQFLLFTGTAKRPEI